MGFITKHNILSPSQFGFRHENNTFDAIFSFLETLEAGEVLEAQLRTEQWLPLFVLNDYETMLCFTL